MCRKKSCHSLCRISSSSSSSIRMLWVLAQRDSVWLRLRDKDCEELLLYKELSLLLLDRAFWSYASSVLISCDAVTFWLYKCETASVGTCESIGRSLAESCVCCSGSVDVALKYFLLSLWVRTCAGALLGAEGEVRVREERGRFCGEPWLSCDIIDVRAVDAYSPLNIEAALRLSAVLALLAFERVRRGLLCMLPPGLRIKSITLLGLLEDALRGREAEDTRESSLRSTVSMPGIAGGVS